MISALTDAAATYSAAKLYLIRATGATEALLHVHAGLLIFVVAALLLRKRMRSKVPVSLVALFAVGNDIVDWASGKPTAFD